VIVAASGAAVKSLTECVAPRSFATESASWRRGLQVELVVEAEGRLASVAPGTAQARNGKVAVRFWLRIRATAASAVFDSRRLDTPAPVYASATEAPTQAAGRAHHRVAQPASMTVLRPRGATLVVGLILVTGDTAGLAGASTARRAATRAEQQYRDAAAAAASAETAIARTRQENTVGDPSDTRVHPEPRDRFESRCVSRDTRRRYPGSGGDLAGAHFEIVSPDTGARSTGRLWVSCGWCIPPTPSPALRRRADGRRCCNGDIARLLAPGDGRVASMKSRGFTLPEILTALVVVAVLTASVRWRAHRA
jgi:prepilin-type N-terminal cleavage/methylation domain-containing protein